MEESRRINQVLIKSFTDFNWNDLISISSTTASVVARLVALLLVSSRAFIWLWPITEVEAGQNKLLFEMEETFPGLRAGRIGRMFLKSLFIKGIFKTNSFQILWQRKSQLDHKLDRPPCSGFASLQKIKQNRKTQNIEKRKKIKITHHQPEMVTGRTGDILIFERENLATHTTVSDLATKRHLHL